MNRPKVYIHKRQLGDFVFVDPHNNCMWSFVIKASDLNSLELCETMLGYEEDKIAKQNAVEVPERDASLFLNYYNKSGNIKQIYTIFKDVFNVDDAYLDMVYNRDIEAHDLLKDAIKEFKKHKNVHDHERTHIIDKLYLTTSNLIKRWNDPERAKLYLIQRLIPECLSNYRCPMHAFIDIFGEMHPSKYSLMYEFYDCGKEEIDYMDELVEKYPDENDIDKFYYDFCEKFNHKLTI